MSQAFSPIAGNEDFTKTGMVSQVSAISAGHADIGTNLNVGGHINGCMTFHTVEGYVSTEQLQALPSPVGFNPGGVVFLRTEPGITTAPLDEDDRTVVFPSKAIIFECVATHGGVTLAPDNAGLSIGPAPFDVEAATIGNFNPRIISGIPAGGTAGRMSDGIAITHAPNATAQSGGQGSRGGFGTTGAAVADSFLAVGLSNANSVTAGNLKVRISYVIVPTPAENNSLYLTGIYGTV